MTPTDDELEVAIEAAAQRGYRRAGDPSTALWHELGPVERQRYRLLVEPLVLAALEALPDRAAAARRDALEQTARRVRSHLCTCGTGDHPSQRHEHWCPGAVVDDELA